MLLLLDGRSRTDLGADPASCADGFINTGLFSRGRPTSDQEHLKMRVQRRLQPQLSRDSDLDRLQPCKGFLFLGTDQGALSFQN